MDFTKLNLEFSNMQNTIKKYNDIVNSINLKIKDNLKNINKYENKIKNTKNKIENDMLNLYITILKNENEYFENILNEKVEKNDKKV